MEGTKLMKGQANIHIQSNHAHQYEGLLYRRFPVKQQCHRRVPSKGKRAILANNFRLQLAYNPIHHVPFCTLPPHSRHLRELLQVRVYRGPSAKIRLQPFKRRRLAHDHIPNVRTRVFALWVPITRKNQVFAVTKRGRTSLNDFTEVVLQDTTARLLPVGSYIIRAIPIHELFDERGR